MDWVGVDTGRNEGNIGALFPVLGLSLAEGRQQQEEEKDVFHKKVF